MKANELHVMFSAMIGDPVVITNTNVDGVRYSSMLRNAVLNSAIGSVIDKTIASINNNEVLYKLFPDMIELFYTRNINNPESDQHYKCDISSGDFVWKFKLPNDCVKLLEVKGNMYDDLSKKMILGTPWVNHSIPVVELNDFLDYMYNRYDEQGSIVATMGNGVYEDSNSVMYIHSKLLQDITMGTLERESSIWFSLVCRYIRRPKDLNTYNNAMNTEIGIGKSLVNDILKTALVTIKLIESETIQKENPNDN